MTNPTFVPQPFAAAASSATKNVIPNTPGSNPALASLEQGFPVITMTPVVAGGVPPEGQDFNGILNLLSLHTVFLQNGNLYQYSADFIGAGGEYNLGSILLSNDGTALFMCNANGVTEDPNDAAATRWTAIFSVSDTTAAFPTVAVTNGTVNLTSLQGARYVIQFTGTLTGNVRVNLPRRQTRDWIIVNSCVLGAFSLTVATSSGTGVIIPSGGFAQPTGVYSDGTNIYPSVSPLGVAISQAPDPSTIAERTNAGYIFATYFNSNNPIQNSLTIGSIMYGTSPDDGFIRKMEPASFAAQIPVASFAGQVSAAQVPLSAVAQWAATIFASAALTGNPTAPTPSASDSDTSIATTAFANPPQSLNPNGYKILPGGLVLQWGFASGSAGAGSTAVAFPVAFPTAIFAGFATSANRNGAGSSGYNFVDTLTVNGMNAWFDMQQTGPGTGSRGGYWFAIGN